jgi:hypothetical protein
LPAARNVFVFNVQSQLAPEMPASATDAGTQTGLADVLKHASPSAGRQGPVLIFDQFEELFTSYQDRRQDRDDLFRQISDALASTPTLRVLFAMREDFIAELDSLIWRLPQGIDARYRLEFLRQGAAISAVTGPAEKCGVKFDAAAASRLVADLSKINVEGREEPAEGEYVEPVQLQIVCKRLWDRLPEDIELVTVDHLERFGDVNEALREFYLAAVHEAAQTTKYPREVDPSRLHAICHSERHTKHSASGRRRGRPAPKQRGGFSGQPALPARRNPSGGTLVRNQP